MTSSYIEVSSHEEATKTLQQPTIVYPTLVGEEETQPQESMQHVFQSNTPLYDMFAKRMEPWLESIQKNETSALFSRLWENLVNMFTFQLVLIGIVLIWSIFLIRTPWWIFVLAIFGLPTGFYSVLTRDPLGMFLYSILNFIGFVYCFTVIDYGLAIVSVSFAWLLTNQVMAFGYLLEFAKEKMKKKQEIVYSILPASNKLNV